MGRKKDAPKPMFDVDDLKRRQNQAEEKRKGLYEQLRDSNRKVEAYKTPYDYAKDLDNSKPKPVKMELEGNKDHAVKEGDAVTWTTVSPPVGTYYTSEPIYFNTGIDPFRMAPMTTEEAYKVPEDPIPEWATKELEKFAKEEIQVIHGESTNSMFELLKHIRGRRDKFKADLEKYKRGLLKASEVISNEETLAEDQLNEEEECIVNIMELASFYTEREISSKGGSVEAEKECGKYEELMQEHIDIIKSFKRNTNA